MLELCNTSGLAVVGEDDVVVSWAHEGGQRTYLKCLWMNLEGF